MEEMVSIVIPLYNGQNYIAETLNACLMQTYRNIEIVICDDQSSDKGIEIAQAYEKANDHIRLYRNEQNMGVIRTVNRVIPLTRGDYILVLGQDDLLPAKHIERMMKYFDDHTALVFCSYTIINSESSQISGEQSKYKRDIVLADLARENCLHSCGLISRKASMEEAGLYSYNPEWKNYGEWDLWIKMSQYGRLRYCPETSALYRRHDTNMTNEFKNRGKYKIHREYCLHCMEMAKRQGAFTLYETIRYDVHFIKYYMKSLIHYMMMNEEN